ncbi:amidohydrolase family protein [Oscillospiraceae bacterium PP1C4]
MKFDTLIRGAVLVDGLCQTRKADVYLKDGKLAQLGTLENTSAERVIDAQGKLLCPGFIDIHRHADLVPFSSEPSIEIPQGITTMVSGNCGFAAVPNHPASFEALRAYAQPIMGRIPQELKGLDSAGLFQRVEQRPLALNCGYLAGSGALRICAKGFDPSPMSAAEMKKVCDLLDKCLTDGALGVSFGLLYTPECFYSHEELCQIAQVAASHNKPVIAHIRGEGASVLASIDEMLDIGRRTSAKVHISHLKAAGKNNWNHTAEEILRRLEAAKAEGLRLSFDAYPYDAGSTTLLTLFPPETLGGGTEGFLKQVQSPERRRYIIEQLRKEQTGWDNLVCATGWQRVMVAGSSVPEEIGCSIQKLAEEKGTEPETLAMDLLLRENGNLPIVFEHMAQEDVDRVICHPDAMVISDSLYSSDGSPHPRKYGTHARFLRRYVKETQRLTLEQAIAKLTWMPADFLNLSDRGSLRQGNWADLLLLDWEQLCDKATYLNPKQLPQGIEMVFVNGEIAFEKGVLTGTYAGKLLLQKK